MIFSFIFVSGPSLTELREKRGVGGAGNRNAAIIGSPRGSRSIWGEIEKQPFFLPTMTAVTAQEGGHAFFVCKVANLYNQTVSTYLLNLLENLSNFNLCSL